MERQAIYTVCANDLLLSMVADYCHCCDEHLPTALADGFDEILDETRPEIMCTYCDDSQWLTKRLVGHEDSAMREILVSDWSEHLEHSNAPDEVIESLLSVVQEASKEQVIVWFAKRYANPIGWWAA
jgi:hypothetical protein